MYSDCSLGKTIEKCAQPKYLFDEENFFFYVNPTAPCDYYQENISFPYYKDKDKDKDKDKNQNKDKKIFSKETKEQELSRLINAFYLTHSFHIFQEIEKKAKGLGLTLGFFKNDDIIEFLEELKYKLEHHV